MSRTSYFVPASSLDVAEAAEEQPASFAPPTGSALLGATPAAEAASERLASFLWDTSVSALLRPAPGQSRPVEWRDRQVVGVPASAQLDEVQAALRKHSLHAVAVFDSHGVMLGFVDVLDIACHLAEQPAAAFEAADVVTGTDAGLEAALRDAPTAGELINLSGRDRLETVHESAPLASIVERLVGVHRVAVESGGGVADVVSHRRLLRLVRERFAAGEPLFAAALPQLGLVGRPVETVPETATVLEALRKMAATKRTALAVVEANGYLVGTFSSGQVKDITADSWDALGKPLSEFRPIVEGWPVSVRAEAKLSDVLDKLVEGGLGRVWVCREESGGGLVPSAVVSSTDVVALLHDVARRGQDAALRSVVARQQQGPALDVTLHLPGGAIVHDTISSLSVSSVYREAEAIVTARWLHPGDSLEYVGSDGLGVQAGGTGIFASREPEHDTPCTELGGHVEMRVIAAPARAPFRAVKLPRGHGGGRRRVSAASRDAIASVNYSRSRKGPRAAGGGVFASKLVAGM